MNCPHCSKALEGVLDQATHVARLQAKQQQIDTLTAERDGLKTKADGYEALEQRATAAEDLARQWEGYAGRFQLVADPQLVQALPLLEVAHKQAMAARPEGERVKLDAWMRDPKGLAADPIVGHLATKLPGAAAAPAADATPPAAPGASPPAAPGATPPAAAPGATPPGGTPPAPGAPPAAPPAAAPPSQTPPPAQGAPSPQELAKYFQSAEYRSMPPDKQREKRVALEQQVQSARRPA